MKHLILNILTICFSIVCLQIRAQTKPQSNKNNASTNVYIDKVNERQPQFPGGPEEFLKFIKKNLKYPKGEIEAEGKVIISFMVQQDGRTTDFKVEKSLHPAFDDEALIMLKKMPKWEPGMQFGRPVKCRYTIPLDFRIPEN